MKIIPIFLLGFSLMVYDICYSQDIDGPNSKHERWDYILEDTGDVLVGAAIGIGSTYPFTKPYFKEHMNVGLSAGKDHYVLTFKYKF